MCCDLGLGGRCLVQLVDDLSRGVSFLMLVRIGAEVVKNIFLANLNYLAAMKTWYLDRVIPQQTFNVVSLPVRDLYPHPLAVAVGRAERRLHLYVLAGLEPVAERLFQLGQLRTRF